MPTVTVGLGYLKTYRGILKLLQLIFGLIGFIIAIASGSSDRRSAFFAANIGGFIISAFFLFLYITKIASKGPIFWLKTELFLVALWGLFYLIVSSLMLATLSSMYIAAGTFGILATTAYLMDAIEKYMNW